MKLNEYEASIKNLDAVEETIKVIGFLLISSAWFSCFMGLIYLRG